MGQQAQQFRRLLDGNTFIVSPGVYDGYSIRLVQAAGYPMASTSGAAISNALLGVPDAGVMGLSENVNHCRHLARAVGIPLTADADTGYGNPMNVHYTVQQFEEAGVAGVNIEDQVSPKRCGHMAGKDVVPIGEMVRKIEAACMARKDDAFAIIARTDAIAVEGIDRAVERAAAYAKAGADMIFPDAVQTEEQIARIVEACGIPVTVNMGFGIRSRPTTPLIPVPRLRAIGVRRITLPRMLPAASIHAMQQALSLMRQSVETGEPIDRPDLLVGIEDIMQLMGYDQMRALESRLMSMPIAAD
jgi:2-methylisocitrate lyase-like PEP mutase family enzyme